jgi:DNA-binding GntR family transcriptional regulator
MTLNSSRNVGPKASRRPLPKGERRGHVYDVLRERILLLDLQPGSLLDEASLGRELNVSRTPLREALVRLAAEDLVEVMPNRGARVAPIELAQLQQHLEAFELLQRTATVLAAQRRTEADLKQIDALCKDFELAHDRADVHGMILSNLDFHQAIGAAAGNRHIERMYNSVLSDNLRVARLAMAYECYGSTEAHDRHLKAIVDEHRLLLKALADRNIEEATRLADSHSNLARIRVIDYFSWSLTTNIAPPRIEQGLAGV